MADYEIYKPDLNRIDPDKDGLPGLTAKRKTAKETIDLIKTIPLKGHELTWIIYGLILKYSGYLEKAIPAIEKNNLPGWFKWTVVGLAKLISWQAKRLKQ